MDEHWLCNRCLAVVNTTTSIWAYGRKDSQVTESYPGSVTNVAQLRAWAEDKVASGDWLISIDAMTKMFAPVSTWHGDPVCEVHLRRLLTHELSGQWY